VTIGDIVPRSPIDRNYRRGDLSNKELADLRFDAELVAASSA